MRLFSDNKTYSEFHFDKEVDFEKEIVERSKLFFGTNSIYIDAKKKIETKALGDSIPDGFLFDLSDKETPEFYLVEVELSKHDFNSHIFKQITKFFGFFKNPKSQADLVEKIYSTINNDQELKKEFKKYLGEKEIYKFLKDSIEKSQNILLVIDGEKKELPEIMETYSDTWGKMLKKIILKKFINPSGIIYSMEPEFENIEFAEIEKEDDDSTKETNYDEAYHLEGVTEDVRKVYSLIKQSLTAFDKDLVFNSKKYYISIKKEKNVAFFLIGRKKITLIVLNPEDKTRTEIKKHTIKTLSSTVQKFWNGPSCGIVIENPDELNEIIELLKRLTK